MRIILKDSFSSVYKPVEIELGNDDDIAFRIDPNTRVNDDSVTPVDFHLSAKELMRALKIMGIE